jgi:hypothetical protein
LNSDSSELHRILLGIGNILHQRNLDYSKHCKYALGMYVQAHEDRTITNRTDARSIDCLYLRYNDNVQGGHELLHLNTNAVLTRRTITPVPITPAIIRQVDTIATQEDVPVGLKIKNRTGQVFYDSAWVAGVDYDAEAFEDDLDHEDYEEYEEEIDWNDDGNEVDYEEVDWDEATIQDSVDASEHNDDDDEDPPVDNAGVGPQQQIEDELSTDDSNDESEQASSDEESNPDTVQDDIPNQQVDDVAPMEEGSIKVTRSGRVSRPPTKLTMAQPYNEFPNSKRVEEEYTIENGRVIAQIMCYINEMKHNPKRRDAFQFIQTYSLVKGLKKFGDRGRQAAYKEMKQLHDRVVFKPIKVEDLTEQERRRTMESLIFLVEKRDGSVKARTCVNGSTQRGYMDRDEATSPTASTESILLTAVIDAQQRRDVMTADIPNAFVQTSLGEKPVGERITMKIRGPLVDMLIEMSPETYSEYVVYEGPKRSKVLYVLMIMALYGMLQSSLLYYKKFRKDIESIGFKVNDYDPCVANRIVNGKQHTVTWHVDDLKSSHVDPKVNDEFLEWLQKKYASDKIGEVKAVRGVCHDYLAMELNFSIPGVLQVDMTKYVKSMVNDFPEMLEGKGTFPWTNKLFTVDNKSKKLDDKRAAIFHTFVMKGMFLCKRGRQDIQPGIAFLATRTSQPNEGDWAKLKKLLLFLKVTQDDVMSMSADDSATIKWMVDAAFAVHPDMKSHTGATLTLGTGVICSVSTKQKRNSRSSTEAEFIAVDDVVSKVLWTKLFLESQGHKVKSNIIFRDNTSSMKLEENGKASSGKRTRHWNITYFYITDLIQRGEVEIQYCPTDAMLGDYMSKPLIGTKFLHFRKMILGLIAFINPG